ncbi:hypothetical protein YC2023_021532 [Brassica napus]
MTKLIICVSAQSLSIFPGPRLYILITSRFLTFSFIMPIELRLHFLFRQEYNEGPPKVVHHSL